MGEDEATEVFVEQIEGLRNGGADVIWIETMSAPEEARAAARAAIAVGAPYTATASFDTAGRTMMGLEPAAFARAFEDLAPPVAVGANCGVGAADLVVSVLAMTEARPDAIVIAKANAGLPQSRDGRLHYSGSPEPWGATPRWRLTLARDRRRLLRHYARSHRSDASRARPIPARAAA